MRFTGHQSFYFEPLVSGAGARFFTENPPGGGGVRDRTCGHLCVRGGRPVRDDALDLQELVRLVSPDDGEAEAHAALLQRRGQEAALQLGGVPREQGLFCKGQEQGEWRGGQGGAGEGGGGEGGARPENVGGATGETGRLDEAATSRSGQRWVCGDQRGRRGFRPPCKGAVT